MKNTYDNCLIEASGNFLTECFTMSELDCEENMLKFISEHKREQVGNTDDKAVLELIENLALSLEQFLKVQVSAMINEQFPLTLLAGLSEGAKSDIWYDATECNDVAAATMISETQSAMLDVSEKLQSLILQNR